MLNLIRINDSINGFLVYIIYSFFNYEWKEIEIHTILFPHRKMQNKMVLQVFIQKSTLSISMSDNWFKPTIYIFIIKAAATAWKTKYKDLECNH